MLHKYHACSEAGPTVSHGISQHLPVTTDHLAFAPKDRIELYRKPSIHEY